MDDPDEISDQTTSFEAAAVLPELTGALEDSFGKIQIVHAVISL
ncbi:hypothetical protein PQR64_37275 [Paraburkholderia phytofirmans]